MLPKARLLSLAIDELSGVDKACQEPATVAIIKRVVKATWTTATIDDLPDNSFLYVEPGGSKDAAGKTTPRSLRHFPYKDSTGKIDIAHLRDAIGRIPQSSIAASLREKLQQKAEKILAAQHTEKRATVSKSVMLTSAAAGHTHLLDDGGGTIAEGGSIAGDTEYSSTDDGLFHSHPWARTTDGTIVIGEAADHVHVLITTEQLTEIVAADGEADDDEDDVPAAKRKEQAMPPEVKTLEADLIKARAYGELNDEQKAFYKTLDEHDQKSFLAKSAKERQAEVAKAADANPVAYTSTDGTVYRKSDDARLVKMAKERDEDRALIAKRDGELEVERLTKRASSELGNLPGAMKGKIAFLKAIDSIPDEEDRKVAKQIANAGNAALSGAFQKIGVASKNGETDGDPQAQLTALTKRQMEADPKLSEQLANAMVLKTAEGKRLYAELESAKRRS